MTAVVLLVALFVLANLLLSDRDAQDFYGREIAAVRHERNHPRSSCPLMG